MGCRWFGPRATPARHRRSAVCGTELLPTVAEHAARAGWRFFFYGGKEGVPELLAKRLIARFPGLQIVGTHSPPFRPPTQREDDDLVAEINAAQPDVVWVGLSTPKQERWMAAHLGRVHAPVLIGVGAAFDLHAGLSRRAPRWMQRSGLEWSYRMVTEPRLVKRYLTRNPRFVWKIVRRRPRVLPRTRRPDVRVSAVHDIHRFASKAELLREVARGKTVLHLGAVGETLASPSSRAAAAPQSVHAQLTAIASRCIGVDINKRRWTRSGRRVSLTTSWPPTRRRSIDRR